MYGTYINSPKGLVPSSYSQGSTFNHQTAAFQITSAYGTAMFQGDPVIQLNGGGIGQYAPGAPTIGLIGVLKGVSYTQNGYNYELPYYIAGTVPANGANITAYVWADPSIFWDIQSANGAGGQVNPTTTALVNANTVVTQPTLNMNYLVSNVVTTYTAYAAGPLTGVTPASNPASGSTTQGGASCFYLAANSYATTATLPLTLHYLTPEPGNVSGIPFNNGICTINNHKLKGGTGTVGI